MYLTGSVYVKDENVYDRHSESGIDVRNGWRAHFRATRLRSVTCPRSYLVQQFLRRSCDCSF
jgi:hypothetical protein